MIIEPTEHVNEDTPFPKKFQGRIFLGNEVTWFWVSYFVVMFFTMSFE